MKRIRQMLPKAFGLFLVFTVVTGIIYTAVVTGAAQLFFGAKAQGSLITVDGKTYGSELLGQRFTGDGYLWGRVMNLDVNTYRDKEGKRLMYAGPSNLSPASAAYGELIRQRVEKLRRTNPAEALKKVPVDLVTVSGSGLDPDISPAAAFYQVSRIAKARGFSEAKVRGIIEACTKGRFLGVFGEPAVNVLKVNLMLDGILKAGPKA